MDLIDVFIYIIVFLYGIVIGSFLNVCIYRIPRGESLSKKRSHCMSCGYRLAWFDLI
ncbi:MAG: prepilin peptidase, partial [Oscillospiraceae bacterium]|nr:prepilin peptidase [Oscillospiraceae bacterium]